METITEKLFYILKEYHGETNPKLTDNLMHNLSLDDLDIIEFIMTIEEYFGIQIYEDEEHIFNNGTIQDIIDYIADKTQGE